jgi:hypothetical protein
MKEKTNFDNELDKGNRRMAIVITVWSILFAIPTLILMHYNENDLIRKLLCISWTVEAFIGILLSPKIVNKIWKQ